MVGLCTPNTQIYNQIVALAIILNATNPSRKIVWFAKAILSVPFKNGYKTLAFLVYLACNQVSTSSPPTERLPTDWEISKEVASLDLGDLRGSNSVLEVCQDRSSKIAVQPAELPVSARSGLQRHFKGYRTDEMHRFRCAGQLFFQVKVSRVNYVFIVVFDQKGQVRELTPLMKKS